ncbi:hypothetical protein ABPG72_009097 [Tetrahymena utriculariae]
MHKNQSIQEDKEQQFAKPLDNEYASFEINNFKSDRRQNNQEEYEYTYQRDYTLSSIQVSQKSQSESKSKQIQSPIQQNGHKQNEVQIAEISFDENDGLQIQKETPLFQGQANFPVQKEEANSYFKNYIAYLKHKNNASVRQESGQQRMQNPIQSRQNGNDQNIQSVNLSPIQKMSHQKSQSFNQSQDEQQQEDDNRSEISQIQKYIKKKKEEHLNKQSEIKNLNIIDANNSQDLIAQDNLDYAELIIKKKPKLTQINTSENPQIKKALFSQFQEENQKESQKAQPLEDYDEVEGGGYKQNQSTEGELFVSNEEALQKAEEQRLSTYISRQVIRLSLENQKKILFQGELQKYKPGLNYNFISRFITLNLESIKYYKDRVHSKCYEDKPLQVIPIASIQSVSKVQFQVPLLPKEKQRQKNNLQKLYPDNLSKNVVVYYFEITLDNNENKAENDSLIGNKIQFNHLMPQDKLDSYRNGELNKQIKDLTTWSGRSHEWYESEQRFLFCTQDKLVLETWVALLNWIISLKKDQNISSYSLLYSTERIEN